MNPSVDERAAELYDVSVPDWPGEIDFYQRLAAEVRSRAEAVLEIACGTGRVAIRLAQGGTHVTGIDRSGAMLNVARHKSAGLSNARWVQADMRSFDLDATFGLAIIPGHSFQHMLTPDDQMACLACIRRHLTPGGVLVLHLDHQDVAWLGELCTGQGGVLTLAQEVAHPRTGRRVRVSRAWSYERSTQTASLTTVWEEIDADGAVVDRWQRGPVLLHCVFRFEMGHLLARAGFEVVAVYGDFGRGPLTDESSEMIWAARNP
jgi:ubiquinone/menaquinone biosynthesis C-methylase UbiE